MTGIAPGSCFRKDGTFAILCSLGGKTGLIYKLKSTVISVFVFEHFRPSGEVLFGVCSSDFIIVTS